MIIKQCFWPCRPRNVDEIWYYIEREYVRMHLVYWYPEVFPFTCLCFSVLFVEVL